MPATGLEPVRPKAADFKSAASTIPPGGPAFRQHWPAGRKLQFRSRVGNRLAQLEAALDQATVTVRSRAPTMFRAPAIEPKLVRAKAPPPARPRRRGRPIFWRLVRWSIILAVWGALAGALSCSGSHATCRGRRTRSMRSAGPAWCCRTRRATWSPLTATSSARRCACPTCHRTCRRRPSRWRTGDSGPIRVSIHGASLRAVIVNLFSGRLRQGGSTITQQVAKNLFLSNARTMRRKVQELMLTAVAGAPFHQAGDSRDLAEPRISRLGRVGHGCRRARFISAFPRASSAVAVRRAGRPAARAPPLQSARGSAGRRRAQARGAGRDGRDRRHHQGAG